MQSSSKVGDGQFHREQAKHINNVLKYKEIYLKSQMHVNENQVVEFKKGSQVGGLEAFRKYSSRREGRPSSQGRATLGRFQRQDLCIGNWRKRDLQEGLGQAMLRWPRLAAGRGGSSSTGWTRPTFLCAHLWAEGLPKYIEAGSEPPEGPFPGGTSSLPWKPSAVTPSHDISPCLTAYSTYRL